MNIWTAPTFENFKPDCNEKLSTLPPQTSCSPTMKLHLPFALTAFAFLLNPTPGAEPVVDPKDLPRIPATARADAVKTFQVHKGFHLDLAASEPLIASPVAVAFDENGRMFVVEMIDYSERRDETPHPGRIKMLEDTDGDGFFDKATIFADNLPWPTAVICWNGGVFVGASPDIIWLKDTNGDGKADERETVFTGFGEGAARLNVQALLNSFNWGLDNRIHGATSNNGGRIRQLKHPEARPLELRGHDFSFDPRTLTMTAEAGGGQHGLSFDNRGRRFACSNSDHIRLFVYDDRYAARNPLFVMPPALVSIAADGPAAEVFRISPDEPWRIIRTRWRVGGVVSGPIEGGGRVSGYFTGATGTTIYRGNAFPPEYLENSFTGDAGGNLVHRKTLKPGGVGMIANRAEPETKTEFIASNDIWFRPVQFANAPDGCLYIVDMYREVIEHPWSLPENIKKHLDLNSGNDRGRVWRVTPDTFKQPKLPQLGRATTTELIATLDNANGWHRDTATRLLYERQEKSAAPALTKLVSNGKSSLGRLHALCALDGLDTLSEVHLATAFKDKDDAVRERAVLLTEKVFHRQNSLTESLQKKLLALTADKSERVRYQLAFTLGEINPPERVSALTEIALRDADSPWGRAAVMSSLGDGARRAFSQLIQQVSFRGTVGGQELLRLLATQLGAQNQPSDAAFVVDIMATHVKPPLTFALLRGLGEGLERAGSSLQRSGGVPASLFEQAKRMAADAQVEEASRAQAIRVLALASWGEAGSALMGLLDPEQPVGVQSSAVSTLARFDRAEVTHELVKRLNFFPARLRSEVAATLLARAERALALLQAIDSGAIRPPDLSATQLRFLRTHRDKNVQELALRVFGAAPTQARQQVVESFMPALNLRGDAANGKVIYAERCASCHRAGNEGFALGPDMVTVKTSGKEKLLVNILDPNREVAPQFIAYEIETKDGESVIGVISGETATGVTVRQAFGKESAVLRSDMKTMRSQGQSLMPDELEAGLTPQSLADLLEFIATVGGAK
jgi:putative membrane-bound dehydrogenase-like protein